MSAAPGERGGNAAALLRRLGFRVLESRPIEWKRIQSTPLILVDTDKGKFVLKLRTPPTGWVGRFRAALADLELPTQARVYEALSRQEFVWLRFPGLVHTDGRDYLLLEYLETRSHGEHDLPRRRLLESLVEFQTADLDFGWRGLSALVAATRSPSALLVRRLVTGVRGKLGWRVARAALEKLHECKAAQPPLPRRYLCHNDFHHNNLLLTNEGELYLSDFEAVTLEDRWVLADIIHFAVATQEFRIDTAVVAQYHQLFVERTGEAVDLPAQLRFGLLARVSKLVLSPVPPARTARQYEAFFREVLLDDRAFEGWLEGNFGTM